MIATKSGPCVGPVRKCNGRILPGDNIRSYLPSGRQRRGWAHIDCFSSRPDLEHDVKYIEPPKTSKIKFDTWDSFVGFAVDSDPLVPGELRSSRKSNSKWYSASWDQAVELARKGWDEHTPTLSRLSSNIETQIKPILHPTFISYYDLAGSDVDLGRFLGGDPECMIEQVPHKIAKSGRVISIVMSGVMSSGVSTSAIIHRGSAIVALVDILSRLQHPTEIWIDYTACGKYSMAVCIKEANDQLDFGRLMFAIGHPASCRRIWFSAVECEPTMAHLVKKCYGSPSYAPLQAPDLNATITLDQIYIGTSPEEWVIDHLTKFGLIGD